MFLNLWCGGGEWLPWTLPVEWLNLNQIEQNCLWKYKRFGTNIICENTNVLVQILFVKIQTVWYKYYLSKYRISPSSQATQFFSGCIELTNSHRFLSPSYPLTNIPLSVKFGQIFPNYSRSLMFFQIDLPYFPN